ncbi:MAG TPA: hypothetical protein VHP11_16055, partial [Tepidisphaeraceae bacterium]|nr:hypothetical protein [Tepidisphaeraceae bacterium]
QAMELRDRTLAKREQPSATMAPGSEAAVQKPREPFRFDAEAERVHFKHASYVARRYGGPMDTIFGPRMRFFVAAVILLGFLMWRFENRTAIVNEVKEMRAMRMDPVLQDPTKVVDTRKVYEVVSYTSQPLRIWGVPDVICDTVGSWNGGVAGLILLLGSFMPSIRIGIPIMISAAIVLLGHYLPVMGRFQSPRTIALLIGVGMAALTVIVKKPEE